MKCKNHPEKDAVARCTGCQEAFCENCLVELRGLKYCGDCKVMAVRESPEFEVPETDKIPCKEASNALLFAIIGIFCLGIILEPYAISRALEAKKLMAEDPRLTGESKATAAITIGIIGLVLWLAGIILKISKIHF